MENKSNNSSNGIGLPGLLQVAFIVLKLCRVINWSWLWVLAPTWGTIAFIIIGSVIITTVTMGRRRR